MKEMKEYKETRDTELESKKVKKGRLRERIKVWKNKIEEILALMKEICKCQEEKEDDKNKEVDDDKMFQEIDRLKEQKSEPKPQTDAAAEQEHSGKAGTNAAAPQRSTQRHEERKEMTTETRRKIKKENTMKATKGRKRGEP